MFHDLGVLACSRAGVSAFALWISEGVSPIFLVFGVSAGKVNGRGLTTEITPVPLSGRGHRGVQPQITQIAQMNGRGQGTGDPVLRPLVGASAYAPFSGDYHATPA